MNNRVSIRKVPQGLEDDWYIVYLWDPIKLLLLETHESVLHTWEEARSIAIDWAVGDDHDFGDGPGELSPLVQIPHPKFCLHDGDYFSECLCKPGCHCETVACAPKKVVCWDCTKCGVLTGFALEDAPYEVGEKEPCCLCEEGTAHVVELTAEEIRRRGGLSES